jgi:hypothetical protein
MSAVLFLSARKYGISGQDLLRYRLTSPKGARTKLSLSS